MGTGLCCAQEEMFDMNWVEYVRRDTEGSDSDTRRRAASELVKSLTDRFPSEVCVWVGGRLRGVKGGSGGHLQDERERGVPGERE